MGQNRGRGGSILTPNELVLPFGGSYVCANFGENRSRNATVRVLADGQIHRLTYRQTDRQTQTDFIICPMLYAIARGQIIKYNVFYGLLCITRSKAVCLLTSVESKRCCRHANGNTAVVHVYLCTSNRNVRTPLQMAVASRDMDLGNETL